MNIKLTQSNYENFLTFSTDVLFCKKVSSTYPIDTLYIKWLKTLPDKTGEKVLIRKRGENFFGTAVIHTIQPFFRRNIITLCSKYMSFSNFFITDGISTDGQWEIVAPPKIYMNQLSNKKFEINLENCPECGASHAIESICHSCGHNFNFD